jgi:hypothetical protein
MKTDEDEKDDKNRSVLVRLRERPDSPVRRDALAIQILEQRIANFRDTPNRSLNARRRCRGSTRRRLERRHFRLQLLQRLS